MLRFLLTVFSGRSIQQYHSVKLNGWGLIAQHLLPSEHTQNEKVFTHTMIDQL